MKRRYKPLTPEQIAERHRRALERGLAGKAQGMSQVDANADPNWKSYARDWIIQYLKTNRELFTDDLWEEGLRRPREMRALGPIINKLARDGVIVAIGTRPRAHGRGAPGQVWRSMIYGQP